LHRPISLISVVSRDSVDILCNELSAWRCADDASRVL